MAVGNVTASPCNRCGRDTQHEILLEQTTSETEYPDSEAWSLDVVVRCKGCGDISIRHEQWWRDLIPDEELSRSHRTSLSFTPYRNWRREPDWLAQLEGQSRELHDLLKEIYTATNDDQVRLLAMGVRAAVDFVMTQRVGDIGGFDRKLSKMVEEGHLTKSQSETLAVVIDAGSAAAHRGFQPPTELLKEMVVIMEGLVRELYITGPMMKVLKQRIPPRPQI